MVVTVIALIFFVMILVAGNLAYWAYKSQQEALDQELSRRIGTVASSDKADIFELQVKDQLVEALGNYGKQLDNLLKQAGAQFTVTGLIQRMVAAGIVGVLVSFVVFRSVAAVVGLGAALLPLMYLNFVAGRRARSISSAARSRRATGSPTRCGSARKRCRCPSPRSSAASTSSTTS